MAGGFFKGAILGGILSMGAAMIISLLVPLPKPPTVADSAPESQVPAEIAQTTDVDAPASVASPEADPAPVTAEVSVPAPAPEPDTLTIVEDVDAPVEVPETGDVADIETPTDQAAEIAVAPASEAPVLPTPQALAPMAPPGVDEVLVTTEPAELPSPQAQAPDAASVTETGQNRIALPGSDQTAAATAPAPLTAALPDATVSEPVTAAPLPKPVEVAEALPAAEPEAETDTAEIVTVPSPFAPKAPTDEATSDASETQVETEVADNPAPEADAPAPQVAEAETAPAPEGEAASETVVASVAIPESRDNLQSATPSGTQPVRIGRPAVNLVDRSTGVKINRSPGLSTVATSAEAPQADQTAPAPSRTGPPIRKYANPFANPDGRPLMSIVLIDTGTDLSGSDVDLAALGDFPYPLSFAVDSSLPDAAERTAKYRADGFEVLAMIDLPEGAAPTDAEVTMSVMLERIPEAVGVLEGTNGGLQGSRDVADQVTEILLQSGHGLVSQSQGLNTMPKLARKLGVPAEPVFRDFDGRGQDARVIRRFLDQAAFKAGQEGAVIMLGRLQPETIKALLLWGLADRASQVALAPVSAVLLRE